MWIWLNRRRKKYDRKFEGSHTAHNFCFPSTSSPQGHARLYPVLVSHPHKHLNFHGKFTFPHSPHAFVDHPSTGQLSVCWSRCISLASPFFLSSTQIVLSWSSFNCTSFSKWFPLQKLICAIRSYPWSFTRHCLFLHCSYTLGKLSLSWPPHICVSSQKRVFFLPLFTSKSPLP
jgi:hypothetical protein